MKHQFSISITCLLLAVANGFAAEVKPADPLAALDQALKESATFEYATAGKTNALVTVEQLAFECAKDARLRPECEARLLKALDSQLTRDAKTAICRQLFIVGSTTSIPKLEALLADPDLSHIARYVLGRMDYPEATAALQRAMAATNGKIQASIIYTLANRRCQAALPEIAKLVSAPDAIVAESAIAALGQLGGPEAIKTLESARPAASPEIQIKIDQALLAAADGLLAANQASDAAAVYQKLYAPERSRAIRTGALRGLIQSQGDASGPLIAEAVKGTDSQLAAIAIGRTRLVNGQGMSKLLKDLMPALSPTLQEVAVRALGDRGDAVALAAISAAVKSTDPAVRLASLEVLGNVGDASSILPLATAAATAGDEQRAARESLAKLKGADINEAIVQAIGSADPKVKVELVKALVGRKSATAAQLLKLAQDSDPAVRREGILGLGWVASEADLDALMKIAITTKDKSDFGPIDEAITSAFRRLGDPAKRTQMVTSALAGASAEVKPVLIRFLRGAACPESLAALRSAVNDPAKEVQDAAIRTLSEWPDSSSSDDLLNIAKSSSNQTHKILALRGVIRLATTVDQPMPLLKKAMAAAERADEKKQVLGALGQVGSVEGVAMALECLKDPAIQNEAAHAIIQLAGKLKGKDFDKAKEGLQTVIETVKDARIKKQAETALEKSGAKPRRRK